MTKALITQAEAWITSQKLTDLNLYAIVDAAQDKQLWHQLGALAESAPLLFSSNGDLTPHLLLLGKTSGLPKQLKVLLSKPRLPSAITVLCSPLGLNDLQVHLRQFAKVKLPGDYEMILAFWDPAVLGTLIGQLDDDTLHVKGPVFSEYQQQLFLHSIVAWWYCDREDGYHLINQPAEHVLSMHRRVSPFVLDQAQEDALVEASVPDQVLYHLELNRPTLFDERLPHDKRYRFIRAVLPSARQLGLDGMRDMTNFVALCLIYRQRIETDPQILHLLDLVQKNEMTLDKALEYMPE